MPELTIEQLRHAEERAMARIEAIENGTAPATPDSHLNAVYALKRIQTRLRNRGEQPRDQGETA